MLSLVWDEPSYPELHSEEVLGSNTWVVWLLNDSDTQILVSGIWSVFLAHRILSYLINRMMWSKSSQTKIKTQFECLSNVYNLVILSIQECVMILCSEEKLLHQNEP